MKAILRVDYTNFVIDVDDAAKVVEILNKAEIYDTHRVGDDTSHHVFANDKFKYDISLLPESSYNMGKLAGKPE